MEFFKKMSLSVRIFIALVLGVAVGFMLQSSPTIETTYIKPFGDAFLSLIKLTIVPLVFSSLIIGIGGMDDISKLEKLDSKRLFSSF